jgi:hypothetical protein
LDEEIRTLNKQIEELKVVNEQTLSDMKEIKEKSENIVKSNRELLPTIVSGLISQRNLIKRINNVMNPEEAYNVSTKPVNVTMNDIPSIIKITDQFLAIVD